MRGRSFLLDRKKIPSFILGVNIAGGRRDGLMVAIAGAPVLPRGGGALSAGCCPGPPGAVSPPLVCHHLPGTEVPQREVGAFSD